MLLSKSLRLFGLKLNGFVKDIIPRTHVTRIGVCSPGQNHEKIDNP